MNQHDFQHDERLKDMDPEQIARLMSLANELSGAPQNQKMNTFLGIMNRTSRQNISFSPQEQEVLFSILTEDMRPDERKKAEMVRKLASQLQRQR